MNLSKNHFQIVSTRGINFYAPSDELKQTSYYKHSDGFWCFKITKKEVFEFLHWEQSDKTHSDVQSSFPEFIDKDQTHFFLLMTLKLHNDTINRGFST